MRTRMHIVLLDQNDAITLVQGLNKVQDTFVIENKNGTRRVNAKSMIGVMYTMMDYNAQTYLVNDDHDGEFPEFVKAFEVA